MLEKLNYLSGMLKGEAARAISGNWAIKRALWQNLRFDQRLHAIIIQDPRAFRWH